MCENTLFPQYLEFFSSKPSGLDDEVYDLALDNDDLDHGLIFDFNSCSA